MAVINGTAGGDFLFGTAEDDQIFGLDGNDTLAGSNGNDALDGGNGNDNVVGNAGADSLTGGAGTDRFTWRISPLAGLVATDSTFLAQDTVTDFEGAGVAGGDTLDLVESSSRRMVFEGALAAMPAVGDSVGFGGDGLTQVFYAFDGGDTVVFADSDDDGILDAGDFAVRLTGLHNLDVTDFGATPFVIAGTSGNDTIAGTDGNDTILGLDGNDTISGGAGNDTIEGGNGNDTLNGDAGNDRIEGGTGNDRISGGDGRDNATGGAGNDWVDGGAGNDNVSGGDGNDVVLGGDGNDNVDGDDGNDLMFGGAGGDDMVAGDGNDALFGEAGDDFLQGGPGSDAMFGGDGDDEIVGYEQADLNHGGAGDDTFGFFLGTFSPSSTLAQHDIVLDFEGAGVDGGDLIDLNDEQVAFGGEVSINPKAGALLPGAGNGVQDLVYTQRNGSTWLIADEDDDGRLDGSDFAVQFAGLHDFTRDDFDNTTFVIAGTSGHDVITGTEDGDIVFAGGGNDQVLALGGDDEVHGGAGNDFLDGGPGGFDNLSGDEGDDTLTLATSDVGGTASGGDGNDVLFGSDTSFAAFDHNLQGDAGNDDLHAGAVGSTMDGGSGADRLFNSAADDQMSGGRDENFNPDGAQDLFVYGTEGWGSDILFGFEDGVDLFDMRGSGLTFADLAITNEDFQTRIESSRGAIDIFENFDEPVHIDEADFLFA